jgi:hypothetical protein
LGRRLKKMRSWLVSVTKIPVLASDFVVQQRGKIVRRLIPGWIIYRRPCAIKHKAAFLFFNFPSFIRQSVPAVLNKS